jgi:ABC-type glycerol-3-phosphate transport system substrate-binding protein
MKKAQVVFMLLLLVPALLITAADKKKLTFWYPAGEITATSMPFRDGSDPWAKFEADNNVQVDVVAIDYDTMQQKVFTALAGGKAPDIAMIDFSWMGGFIKDGALAAIPDSDAKAWMASVSPETVAISDWGGGKMYGFSTWGVDAYALTWNKQMFRDAGLDPNQAPKYWADFRTASKKTAVTDSSGKLTRVGYAMRHLGQPHGIVDKWHWLLVGAGMQLNSDQFALKGGTARINLPSVREGLQMAHDMVWVDKSSSLDFPDPRQALLSGIASMQISELVSIQVRAPKEAPDLDWGFAPPPAMRPGSSPKVQVAAWNYSVFTQSREKSLALKAVAWINNKDNDYNQAKKYDSTPRYKDNWAREPFASAPNTKAFLDLLKYGTTYPRSLALNGILDAVGAAVPKVLHNEASVMDALSQAEQQANDAIQALQ